MAADAFGRIVAAIDYPMYVVTTRGSTDPELAGCLVGFAARSVSSRSGFAALSRQNHIPDRPGRNASGGSPVAEGCNGTRRAIRGQHRRFDRQVQSMRMDGGAGEHAHSGRRDRSGSSDEFTRGGTSAIT